MNPLPFFARFHGGHGGSIWPLIRTLHEKMPTYLPEPLRWLLVVILIASILFLFFVAMAKLKVWQNK